MNGSVRRKTMLYRLPCIPPNKCRACVWNLHAFAAFKHRVNDHVGNIAIQVQPETYSSLGLTVLWLSIQIDCLN